MPNDSSTVKALERQIEELRQRFEEFDRRAIDQSENRNAEIGSLRESLSGSISAADRDAAAVTSLATRLGEAETRLNQPAAPVNWAAIIGLILASAGAVGSLAGWAIENVKERTVDNKSYVLSLDDKVEKLSSKVVKSVTLQEQNILAIRGLERKVNTLEVASGISQEKIRQVEGRVADIDKLGIRGANK